MAEQPSTRDELIEKATKVLAESALHRDSQWAEEDPPAVGDYVGDARSAAVDLLDAGLLADPEQAAEVERLSAELAVARAPHEAAYVDPEHQGGNCVDTIMRLAAELNQARSNWHAARAANMTALETIATQKARIAEQAAELAELKRFAQRDREQAVRATAGREAAYAERDALQARLDVVAKTLARAQHMVATDSRDWGIGRADAWLYGLIAGWDCEDRHEHDSICGGFAATQEIATRHGWEEGDLKRLREFRAALQGEGELA